MRVHHIVPPYLLAHLERTAPDPNLRARYRQSLQNDAEFRARPGTATSATASEGSGGLRRQVHDAEHETSLPGALVRAEGADAVADAIADATVNQAYDGTGATWTMYKECFERDSIDGAGLPLISTVHYDRDYANAFWDGSQLIFGDGDGEIFGDFTKSIEVTGHELTHGVTQYTANLAYEGQSGALNESISDVFGSLAKQHHLGQAAADADWLIGAGIFQPGVQGVALRSMAAPGTAYDDPRLGKDPQPSHMSAYVETTEDSGGVHLNSGIPNYAFYLVATELGGNAWSEAGRIWYATLTSGTLPETADFTTFAEATQSAATTLFGADSRQLTAVTTAWNQVGVLTTSPADSPADPAEPPADSPAGPAVSPSPAADPAAPPPPAEPGERSSGDETGGEGHASSAESADLMRAANTTLAPNTPPAPPEPTATPDSPQGEPPAKD
ncbi:M4 family metallopeptidase [Kribbella qitaiheensis]|uniref:Neutral metalloproteinase n=1 Tax=Kribbella qitaiheensis TaxID=1544730 RepID=A0A7G6X0J3_9ACTN|nr:M4 family metallopeptidase [Kribbella qitaiheensis]QNE19758.1 M4 family metallopeptidase [Kribbella qitaiheensis]